MNKGQIEEFRKLPVIKRKSLDNPGLILSPTPKPFKLEAELNMKKGATLTKRQREIVDLVSAEIMDYTLTRVKQVKSDEWLALLKDVTFLVIAAIKKDHALMLIHLQSIGAFFLRNFTPDFIYESNLFTFRKDGDKVDFKIK